MNNPYLHLVNTIDRQALFEEVYETAKHHHYKLGHNVIPLFEFGKNDGGIYRDREEEVKKRLRVQWKSYVNNRMADDEFEKLFADERNYLIGATRYPPTGLAVVLGPISGVMALDFDIYASKEEVIIPDVLNSPLTDQTTNGGIHAYFKYNNEISGALTSSKKAKTILRIPHKDNYFVVEMLVNQLVLVSPSMVLSKNKQFIGSYEYTKGKIDDFASLPALTTEIIEPFFFKKKQSENNKANYTSYTPNSSGNQYNKIKAPVVFENPELLPEYVEQWHSDLIHLSEGESRHDALLKLANSLVHYGFPDELILAAFDYAQSKYPSKDRQITDSEIDTIVRDARAHIGEDKHQFKKVNSGKDKDDEEKKPNKAEKAVNLALEEGLIVFLDEDKKVRVVMPDKPIAAYYAGSQEFELWLRGLVYKNEKEALAEATLKTIVGTLMGLAASSNVETKTYLRTAFIDGHLYYDLGDGKQLIDIKKGDWDVKSFEGEAPPVYFLYSPLLIEQVLPAQSGNIKEVLNFINVNDERSKIEYLTILVCWMFPHIPRPVLAAVGPKGSAKSTSIRITKMLTDPSRVPLVNSPKDLRELAILTSQQSVIALDNMSVIPQYLSDYIATSVTGGGYMSRELYSNAGLVVFDRRPAFGITSIVAVVDRSDLLSRSVIVEHKEIPENDRLEEAELQRKFEEATPRILHGMFTVASKVLEILPSIKLKKPPRMADYARYAAAAWVAMGGTVEEYEQVTQDNLNIQNETVIENSVIAQALVSLTADWQIGAKRQYKPTELFEALKIIVNPNGSKFVHGFPNAVNKLSSYIFPIKENLRAAGILVDRGQRSSSSRSPWIVEKVGLGITSDAIDDAIDAIVSENRPVNSQNDGSDARDGTLSLKEEEKKEADLDNEEKGDSENQNLLSQQSIVTESRPNYQLPEVPDPDTINELSLLRKYKELLSSWLGEFNGKSRLSEGFEKGMSLQRKLTERETELENK